MGVGRMRFGKRNLLNLTAVAVVLALFSAACAAEPEGQVYEDPEQRSLFAVPDSWNVYQPDELGSVDEIPFANDLTDLPVISSVAFDGAQGRNVGNLGTAISTSAYPIGAQVIRSVGSEQRDLVSRSLLENSVLAYSSFQSSQDIVHEDFSFGSNFDGIRRFVGFIDGATSQEGAAYFLSVTDPTDSVIYSMAAGCSVACFEQYQAEIQQVVDSWLVNTNP